MAIKAQNAIAMRPINADYGKRRPTLGKTLAYATRYQLRLEIVGVQ